MKKAMLLVLLMAWVGLPGCSVESMGNRSGIPVVFDGTPQIIDSSVHYQGATVGRIVSQDWGNGITRVVISLDREYDALKKNNMAIVVKNGSLHVTTLSGYGESLPPNACINGFVNTASFRWFKFKNLIDNINVSADRRAQDLLARSGLSG